MLPHPVSLFSFASRITKRNLSVQMRSPAFFLLILLSPDQLMRMRKSSYSLPSPSSSGLNYTHLLLIVVKSLSACLSLFAFFLLNSLRDLWEERFQQLLQMGMREEIFSFLSFRLSFVSHLSSHHLKQIFLLLSSSPGQEERKKERNSFPSKEEKHPAVKTASQTTHVYLLILFDVHILQPFFPWNKRTNQILKLLPKTLVHISSVYSCSP